ncbi:SAM-dependent methyltransferase [Dactylosporangium sp. NPDC049525]|uniref:SAM-dependent methyltransferase n=1 Tax=Dactylosporangium sp. NPDC049525 TaxID=3154730 RepID=UPI00343D9CBD
MNPHRPADQHRHDQPRRPGLVAAPVDADGGDLPTSAGPGHSGIDTRVPNPARRYDYLLGGKDNFAADRASAEELQRAFPHVRTAAQENRRFLIRAVRFLARTGVRQFLDIGTGYPTAPNVHEAAQAITPDARVLYVDNDPVVVAHARALLTSPQPDAVGYLHADLRNPAAILFSPQTRAALDFQQPIGLLLVAVLHFIDDTDQPYEAVNTLIEGLPPGSYVALSHVTFDPLPDDTTRSLTDLTQPAAGHGPFRARTHPEIERFLDGTDLVDPGLVSIVDWHPDEDPQPAPTASARDAACYGAVARVP